jgi:HisA/HisF family protein
MMLVIPVIDIRNSCVVRAAGGRRDDYQPIETPLSQSSMPLDVARGLLGLHETLRSLYIADLDGIEGRGRNLEMLLDLSAALPGVQLLIDDGSATVDALAAYRDQPLIWPVVGSESLTTATELARMTAAVPQGIVLSLDWRGDNFLGPADLLENPEIWPATVIVMTLARVGSGRGPDLDRLKHIKALAGDRQIYAAGGVRHADDVEALTSLAAGVLVASALHDGAIDRDDLERLAGRSPQP